MRHHLLAASVLLAATAMPATAVVLYDQDFEHPVGFVNDGGDINIYRSINDLYGNQPPGFVFAQTYTTETLLVGGTQAFGTGYVDPDGRGGNYVVAELSDAQDDRLSLAFDVGAYKFLNLAIDLSAIDLDRFGGPFEPAAGVAPTYRFRLFDNPDGTASISGNGTLLDFFDASAPFNTSKTSFLWRHVANGLDASGATNGNVILQIDVLTGGYAAFDNIVVSAADISSGTPEPATWALMIAGFGMVGTALRRRSAALA